MPTQKQVSKEKVTKPIAFPKNKLYAMLTSPALKIAMYVLERGLKKKSGDLVYDESKGMAWLSKMGRDLDGQVSRATIDEYLDTLLDEGILRHGEQEMQKVTDEGGVKKWVRGYFIGNEFLDEIISIYKATHDCRGINTHERDKE